MRPAGEIRKALRKVVDGLAADHLVTYRDMGCLALVGFDEARKATKEMARAGELEPAGTKQVPDSRRPLTLYRRAANAAQMAGHDLVDAMNAMVQAA